MNIKKTYRFWLILVCLMQIGCFTIKSGFQANLESLKIINADISQKTVWYVPIRATITGFGNNGKAVAIKMGNKRLIQGMIKIAPDQNDLNTLTERARQMWGSEAQVKRSLDTTVDMKVTFNGKKLWQHKVMSGNTNGLPLQLTMPETDGGELLVSMSFITERFMSRKNIQVQSSEVRQQQFINGSIKSISMETTGSVSLAGSNSQNIGNFTVEQLIKIE